MNYIVRDLCTCNLESQSNWSLGASPATLTPWAWYGKAATWCVVDEERPLPWWRNSIVDGINLTERVGWQWWVLAVCDTCLSWCKPLWQTQHRDRGKAWWPGAYLDGTPTWIRNCFLATEHLAPWDSSSCLQEFVHLYSPYLSFCIVLVLCDLYHF